MLLPLVNGGGLHKLTEIEDEKVNVRFMSSSKLDFNVGNGCWKIRVESCW